MLEIWNLAHSLEGPIEAFFVKKTFWVWLELVPALQIVHVPALNGHLSSYTYARDLKLGTHIEVFLGIFFSLVQLELVQCTWLDFKLDIYVHRYSRTISAPYPGQNLSQVDLRQWVSLVAPGTWYRPKSRSLRTLPSTQRAWASAKNSIPSRDLIKTLIFGFLAIIDCKN